MKFHSIWEGVYAGCTSMEWPWDAYLLLISHTVPTLPIPNSNLIQNHIANWRFLSSYNSLQFTMPKLLKKQNILTAVSYQPNCGELYVTRWRLAIQPFSHSSVVDIHSVCAVNISMHLTTDSNNNGSYSLMNKIKALRTITEQSLNKYFELKNSWGADGAPQTRTTCL